LILIKRGFDSFTHTVVRFVVNRLNYDILIKEEQKSSWNVAEWRMINDISEKQIALILGLRKH